MNVAIAGCTHIHTPAYIRWLTDHPEVRVLGVGDTNPATARAIAAQLEAPAMRVDEIWTLSGLDAVLILSETCRHRDYIGKATAAGLGVYTEKPLAMTGRDASAIAADVSNAAVPFQIGFFMRQMPAVSELRELVLSGALGQVTRARVSVAHDAALKHWFDAYPWMAERAQAGFGGFGDMAVHGIDLLLWFFGPEIESVTAATGSVAGADGDSDHFGEGMIRFRSGVIATVVSSWVDGANPVLMEVRGTTGGAQVQGNDLIGWGVEIADFEALPVDPSHAFGAFVQAVSTGDAAGLVSIADAALSTHVADTMKRADDEGTWLPVE